MTDRTVVALSGFALRQIRRSKGLSQMALAVLCGVDQTTISMLEVGKAKGSPGVWQRIFRALGLDDTKTEEAV